MKFKMLFAATLFAITATTVFAKPDGLSKVKNSGILTVGVKDDVPGFGYMNPTTKQYEGLEIDIAKAIAKKLFNNETKVKFVPVTAKNRSAFLNQDRIDMVIATFTVTEDRKRSFDFSDVYYTDSVGFMVKKASGITSFKELAGKTVGITQGSMTENTIKKASEKEGVTVHVASYPSNQTLKEALDRGEIDAFGIDKAILHGYLDDSVTILPERYDEMMYAIAIKKDNTAVTKYVNDIIKNLVKSGELDTMLEKNGLAN